MGKSCLSYTIKSNKFGMTWKVIFIFRWTINVMLYSSVCYEAFKITFHCRELFVVWEFIVFLRSMSLTWWQLMLSQLIIFFLKMCISKMWIRNSLLLERHLRCWFVVIFLYTWILCVCIFLYWAPAWSIEKLSYI